MRVFIQMPALSKMRHFYHGRPNRTWDQRYKNNLDLSAIPSYGGMLQVLRINNQPSPKGETKRRKLGPLWLDPTEW